MRGVHARGGASRRPSFHFRVPVIAARDIVFYDGDCGVCHWSVSFLVARDAAHAFDYAPLQGETFARGVAPAQRAALPDSIVVLTKEGELLLRSSAALHLLRRLGGGWGALAALLRVVPRGLADRAYDAFARRRSGLAKRPGGACPLVPAPLRERFLP